MLACGLTVPIESHSFSSSQNQVRPEVMPNTAASFHIKNLGGIVQTFIDSPSVSTNETPRDGEHRVLIRMLPLKLSDKQKMKRADCHLWPIGTFLQISTPSGTKPIPQKLQQRKQQNHDYREWKGLCQYLDLTSKIPEPDPNLETLIELCCHDKQQYMFILAVCKYQTPETLSLQLQGAHNSCLKHLSLSESFDKAKEMMNNNEVSIDDSDNEDGACGKVAKALKRITFSLKDPVSKTTINVPVRGKKCRHFSVSKYVCATECWLPQCVEVQNICSFCLIWLSLPVL
jgi:hypothetical protein